MAECWLLIWSQVTRCAFTSSYGTPFCLFPLCLLFFERLLSEFSFNYLCRQRKCMYLRTPALHLLEASDQQTHCNRLSRSSFHLLWSLFWCHWCCLSSTMSSWYWSPFHGLCRDWNSQPILTVLPLPLSHQCKQQSGYLFSIPLHWPPIEKKDWFQTRSTLL